MEQLNETYGDYAQAFGSVRCAKKILWVLIALMIVVQLASFVLVEFVGVLDPLHKAATATATTNPAGTDQANMWQDVLGWVMPASKFLAFVLAILLSLTLLLGVQISLAGGLGGAAGLVGAFFWSLVLLAALTPWQQLFPSSIVCGATYNLGDLVNFAKTAKADWAGHSVGTFDVIAYYLRFIGYPVVAVLLWLVVGLKFCRGVRVMNLPEPPASSLPAA